MRILISGMLCLFAWVILVQAEELETSNEQTTCPVMEGTPIDRSVYTGYQGKRVYFCCKLCKETFANAPEKYISDLPQFAAGTEVRGANHGHGGQAPTEDYAVSEENASNGLDLYSLVVPLGIGAYSSLVITLFLGLFRRKLRRKFLVLHRSFAFLTVILASAHAALILILY